MPKTRLTVKYINPQHGIDINLDNEIIKVFKNLGFEWWGQGIGIDKPFEREIEFEKEQKI